MLKMTRLTALLLVVLPAAAAAQQRVALPAQDKPLNEKPQQIFQVGAEDGEDWELLSGVRNVAFDAQDNLYVLDANNHRVLVFDPNGKFLRKIGKKGEGPGELIAPIAMTIASDGNIVINDLGRQAYSIFRTNGTFVRNVKFDQGGEGGRSGPGEATSFVIRGGGQGLEAMPNGGLLLSSTESGAPRIDRDARPGPGGQIAIGGGPGGPRKTKIEHFDLTSGATKTLYSFEQAPITPKVEDSGSGSGERRVSVMVQIPAFTPQTNFGALPNGHVAVSHEADYRVRIVDDAGKPVRTIERPIAPKKVTEADKKIAIERRRENMRSGTGMMAIRTDNGRTSFSTNPGREANLPSVDEMLRNATFLDVIPVINRIETDPLGRIWIQRTAADQRPQGPVDVVSADGRYIGTIARDRAPDAVSKSNRAAYVVRDDLGVEHVQVKRLPPTWR